MAMEIHSPDHTVEEYFLGPHAPRLREKEFELLHKIWLEVSESPEALASPHHYHVIGMALEGLQERLQGPERHEMLARFKKELAKPDGAAE